MSELIEGMSDFALFAWGVAVGILVAQIVSVFGRRR